MTNRHEQPLDGKRKFFVRLGLEVRRAFALHKKSGLWDREKGNRAWGNVSEHCLVEVARAQIFADILNFPEDIKSDIMMAAALHDFFKKMEKEIASANGFSWEGFEKASTESTQIMKEAGFSERVVRLANSVGHGALLEADGILGKMELTPEDMAYLALHYIDAYTKGSDWATPAETLPDGRKVNDLDRRADKDESNPWYPRLNEDGRERLRGETTGMARRRIEPAIEERLAASIQQITGQPMHSKDLPVFIDAAIRESIESA